LKLRAFSLILALFVSSGTLYAKSPLQARREFQIIQEEKKPKPQDYYNLIRSNFEENQFISTIGNCDNLIKNYPKSIFNAEATFFQAKSFYNMGDFDLANEALTHYLNDYTNLTHFEEAIRYKFDIAKKFAAGAKKHLFGGRHSPKWLSAKEDAIAIFDEVITTLPRNDLAALSLFSKGQLLAELKSFKEGIEAFQSLTRRFPKHPLASEGYLEIGYAYLAQCQEQFPDPNFIDLAEINIRKFQSDFPGESRITVLQDCLEKMKERFAKELYENGRFYEKKKKYRSAFLYYVNILKKYPSTSYAPKCQEHIAQMHEKVQDPSDLSI
jgi:TolA-binding protein